MKNVLKNLTRGASMVLLVLTFLFSKAATKVWTNGGGDNLWSNSSNWSGGSPGSGDIAQFDVTSAANCIMDVSPIIQGINVTSAYSGVISQGTQTLIVSASLVIFSSAQYNAGTGLVILNGTVNMNTAANINKLKIVGNGNIFFNQNAVVNDSLIITSVNIMYGNKLINVSGNVVINDAWSAAGSNICTVSLVGSGNQTLAGSGNVSFLNINKTGGDVLLLDNLNLADGTLSGSGLLKNMGGRVKTVGEYNLSFTGTMDDLEIASGGSNVFFGQNAVVNDSLTITNVNIMYGNKLINVSGNVVINDAWSAAGASICTVSLVGSGNQTLAGSGNVSFLNINKTGGDVLLLDNLNLADGTLSGSGLLKNMGGRVKTVGEYNLSFTGTMDDLEIASGGSNVFFGQNAVVNDSLTITSVNILYGNKLIQVSGNVVINDAWSAAGASICTVSLVDSGNQTLAGSGNVSFLNINKTGGDVLLLDNLNLADGTLSGSGLLKNMGGRVKTVGEYNLSFTGTMDDLEIASGGSNVFFGQNAVVNDSLTITSVNILYGNKQIQVSGNVVINDAWSAAGASIFSVSLVGTGNQTLSGSGQASYIEFAKPSGDWIISTSATSFTSVAVTNGIWNLLGSSTSSSSGYMLAGGKIGGSGTLNGNVTASSGGGISPGSSTGCLTINGNLTMNSGSTYHVEINGAAACSEHDQISVNGTVTLNSPTLTGGNGSPSTIITILQNDNTDNVGGTFSGMANNATISLGGTQYVIKYNTPSGNDITLTALCSSPTVPTLSSSISSICGNQNSTLSITSGSLNHASNWQWYSGSCGGTSVGSGSSIVVSPTVTTTYYARGEGGCVTPGSCGNITITVTGPGVPSGTNIFTGDVTISTQTQMDAFFNGNNGNKWSKVVGDLTINGNSTTDPITSLCNLSSLTEVTGYLLIQQFTQTVNPMDLGQLAALSKTGRLTIITCPYLETISLPGLANVNGSLIIRNNRNVKTIKLSNLSTMGGDRLMITRNHRAETIQFSNTTSSFSFTNSNGAHLEIQNNGDSAANALTMDFNKITSVARDLTFSNNQNNGVSNFDNIFSGLRSIGGNLVITNNSSLNTCCIAVNITVAGTTTITGNTGDCYDLAAALNDCVSFTKRQNKKTLKNTDLFTNLKLYPNPHRGKFEIELTTTQTGTLNISVLDMVGRIVFNQSQDVHGTKSIPVNLQNTEDGQYFVKLELNGIVVVKRVQLISK